MTDVDNKRIVNSYNLANASFTLTATEFGNEWQGARVSIGLTVQAIQVSHINVDDITNTTLYQTNQDLVDAIAGVKEKAEDTDTTWIKLFGEGISVTYSSLEKLYFKDTTPESGTLSVESGSLSTLNRKASSNVNLMAETNNRTIEILGVTWGDNGVPNNNSEVTGHLVIPKYVEKIGNDWYRVEGTGVDKAYAESDSMFMVTSVADFAFVSLEYIGVMGDYLPVESVILTGVTIPNSVTSIGYNAFDSCVNLTNVTFESGSKLERIGSEAFGKCISLTSIEIPATLTSIS